MTTRDTQSSPPAKTTYEAKLHRQLPSIKSFLIRLSRSLVTPRVLAHIAIGLGCLALVLCTLSLNAGSADTTSDWIAAFGTAFGAALTGGALLIAASTYRRQVAEKRAELLDKQSDDAKRRRQDAESVTVHIGPAEPVPTNVIPVPAVDYAIRVRNDGDRSVFGITLVLLNKKGNDAYQEFFSSVPPREAAGFKRSSRIVGGAYATFTDQAGTRWKRWHNGEIYEISHYPNAEDETNKP